MTTPTDTMKGTMQILQRLKTDSKVFNITQTGYDLLNKNRYTLCEASNEWPIQVSPVWAISPLYVQPYQIRLLLSRLNRSPYISA